MTIKDTVKQMRDLLGHIQSDLEKSDGGNKAASQRVRTGTVKLEKIAKRYRKESIVAERSSKNKRPAKKASKTKAAAAKGKSKAAKSRGRSGLTSVGARSFAVRRPTAKLPISRKG